MSSAATPDRPVRFRDVFASGEFRALYAGSVLSWIGDYMARAAVTAMVYHDTQSEVATAAAFAISFAPWLLGGSVLVAVAERYPYRNVMVLCDVARLATMTVLAVLGSAAPLPLLLALLLLTSLFSPPFDAARSATLPAVLGPQRYVTGLAVHSATAAPMQVAGYFLGATIATAVDAQLALAINAASFGASALLVRFAVRLREPGLEKERRTGLLRETGDGFRIVFTNPALRALVLLVFCGSLFAIVPEGLGAAWAAHRADEDDVAWAQGLLMGAVPAGMLLGSIVVSRVLRPSWRRATLRPLAIATPLVLVPAIIDPPVPVAAALALVSGFAIGALVPVANAEFVLALPTAYRARAFGVVSGGLQLLQGAAILATGALAQQLSLPVVVGLWSLGGVVLMLGLVATWPSGAVFTEAGKRAAAVDAAQASPEPHATRGVRPEPRAVPAGTMDG